MRTVFLRAIEADEKPEALLAAIHSPETAHGLTRFEVETATLATVPGSPFAYWVSDRLRRLFSELPAFESCGRVARQGGVTGDDFRWLRLRTEVPLAPVARRRYSPIAKGGCSSKFYADLPLVAKWDDERNTFWGFTGLPHRPSLAPASAGYYFRPGLTWPLRTGGLSVRAMPANCIFGHKGPAALVANDDHQELMALAAVMNSRAFGLLISMQLARTELAQSYEVGLIQNTPVPNMPPSEMESLAALARRAWALRRSLDTRNETSQAFELPAILQCQGPTLGDRIAAWTSRVHGIEADLAELQARIDELCSHLYDIQDADRLPMCGQPDGHAESDGISDGKHTDDDDADAEIGFADSATVASELVSWAVGVALGRFDIRMATGAPKCPTCPDPFHPLSACSPGMLKDGDGLPQASPPSDYPLDFPKNGMLVDDAGHPRDLASAVRAVFDLVFVADADARWGELSDLLDPQNRNLRHWLAKEAFEQHVRRYSRNRRKAPIFWQLATPSASYSVWLYAHRLTKDTFYQIQDDLVARKLSHEQRKLATLTQDPRESPTANQRKELAAQETFIEELRTFRDEVGRIAPLWNPDLDDGVVIAAAPLWRLFPQHKPWQKELQSVWDKLVAGDYDWAHLSMHLWPERVVPKCADDRSLAIAHELEDMLWVVDDGSWRKLKEPKREIAEQKACRDKKSHRRLRDGLRALAEGKEGTLPAAEVWQQLEAGKLDESLAALCLHPRRVLELCLADPDLARRLEVKPPGKRTKTALEKLVRQYETAGYGTLTSTVRAALAECPEPFAALWRRLEEGDLDDLPLALALWPDRVVDRCTEDRDLADRHELMRYFWYREPSGDWRQRKSPQQEVADEVDRRHNPTVKVALQSLLDAARPGGNGGTRRKKRSST